MTIPPWTVLFFGAELIFLLMRKKDIEVLFKKKSQREKNEQYQVDRGLMHSVLLEGIVFVPVSATLMLLFTLLVVSLLESRLAISAELLKSLYAGIGALSYQFPFATVQRLITQRALKVLNKFSEQLAPPEYRLDENTETGSGSE